uniref:Uncharacterized protein n=1 Tax=Candidatus Entotheonella serta TaxID=1652106 RepID=A0A2P1AMD3_9BACT|nr:hypothetical protein [Candidatus Entotheonella serta]
MSTYYDEAIIPIEMRRNFDVYDRIETLGLSLGTFEDNVVSLADAHIASVVIHESGLVYLSGSPAGTEPMADDEARIQHGFEGAQQAADVLIRRLHWALSCGGEGDLNDVLYDVLYTVKALGMVVSPGGGVSSAAPAVTNGFSFRWHSVFGGGKSDFAIDGVDPGGFAGVHARSAIGGFDGRFSIEPEIIVAIPPDLARYYQPSWLALSAIRYPLVMLEKVQAMQSDC